MTLGDRIRELRESAGLTQSELAARSGMTRQQIYGFETGKYPDPRLSTCTRLADALGCSVDELAGRRPKRSRR